MEKEKKKKPLICITLSDEAGAVLENVEKKTKLKKSSIIDIILKRLGEDGIIRTIGNLK